MNGKKAKAIRRLVRETSGNLPERELVEERYINNPQARVNAQATQHARYKGLKAQYKEGMRK